MHTTHTLPTSSAYIPVILIDQISFFMFLMYIGSFQVVINGLVLKLLTQLTNVNHAYVVHVLEQLQMYCELEGLKVDHELDDLKKDCELEDLKKNLLELDDLERILPELDDLERILPKLGNLERILPKLDDLERILPKLDDLLLELQKQTAGYYHGSSTRSYRNFWTGKTYFLKTKHILRGLEFTDSNLLQVHVYKMSVSDPLLFCFAMNHLLMLWNVKEKG